MKKSKNTIMNRIAAVVLLVATIAGIATSVNKKVEAACNHSKYTRTIVSSPSCTRTGSAYCTCSDCKYTWYQTLPKSAHSYYVKEVNGMTQLRCKDCNERFYFKSTQASINDFARYMYGKNYDQLSGNKISGEKYNVVISWISYVVDCTKVQAKELREKNYNGLCLDIDKTYNLSFFINKCSDIASRYGLEEADALAGIASQAVFSTCVTFPSLTDCSKELAVLAKTNPSYTRLSKDYKAKCREFLNLKNVEYNSGIENKFAYCYRYGINFKAPSNSQGIPSVTPTYSQLFNTTSGKTNLDRFCGYLVGNENVGFREICKYKSYSPSEYSYIMLWLVRPALEKLYANCFRYISSDPMVLFSATLEN